MGRRRILRKLEALQQDVTEWQRRHRQQIEALERQMTDIERSVAHAHADAREAASTVADIETNVLRRIEQIEHWMEIKLLISQGRLRE